MKICFIAKPSSIHTRRWLEWFTRKGHVVHLIAVGEIPETMTGVHVVTQIKDWVLSNPLRWLNVMKVRKIVRVLNPDIIHAHQVHDCGWMAWMCGFHPYIITAWGSDIRLLPSYSRTGLGKKFTGMSLQKADIITTVTEDLKKRIINFGVSQDKIHIILWGVDLNKFRPGLNTQRLREELKLGQSKIVLSVRNMTPIYNIEIIIKSIPKVLSKMPDVKFIFCGSGYMEKELKKLSEILLIQHAVRFVGSVPYQQMPEFFNLADVCVSVTSSDGTPSSMLECMACGTPLVVSDIEPYREWICNGDNGFLVHPGNEMALANALLSILSQEDLAERMSAKNLELVKVKADQEQQMTQMEKIYKEVVHKK